MFYKIKYFKQVGEEEYEERVYNATQDEVVAALADILYDYYFYELGVDKKAVKGIEKMLNDFDILDDLVEGYAIDLGDYFGE